MYFWIRNVGKMKRTQDPFYPFEVHCRAPFSTTRPFSQTDPCQLFKRIVNFIIMQKKK